MKKCSKCKEKFSNRQNFCWNDGTKLKKSIEPKCAKCGEMKIGKFCSGCGCKFEIKMAVK